jgi:hypothetical protein
MAGETGLHAQAEPTGLDPVDCLDVPAEAAASCAHETEETEVSSTDAALPIGALVAK